MGGVLDKDAGPLVPWQTIGRERFDELVEALIQYQHPDGTAVQPVDGRGGDGGIDIRVDEPDGRVVVYQLKYLPDGFDGKHRAGRAQIKKSLKTALDKVPEMTEWVLVAPCEPTRSGWVFINQELRELVPEGREVTIRFVDRSQLNGHHWVAGHPDVARALITRDELLEKAVILKQETAVMTNPAQDLIQRHRALNSVVDDVDPDWTLRTQIELDGTSLTTLVAKHPNAHAASPVGISFSVDEATPEGAEFGRAVRLGMLDPVRLPGTAVSRFRVTGPPIVSGMGGGETGSVEIQPLPSTRDPIPLTLTFLGEDGRRLASHVGRVRALAPGTAGVSVRHEFYDECVVIDWRMPTDGAPGGGVDVTQDFRSPKAPEQMRGAASLLLALHEPFRARLTTLDGAQVAELKVGEHTMLNDDEVTDLRILGEVADDLVYVQGQTGRQFPFPETINRRQRIDLRILRRLLEGRVVCDQERQTLHVKVAPRALDEPQFELLLTDPGQILHTGDGPHDWSIEALEAQGDDAVIVLDEPLDRHFPELVADNADEVRAALEHGQEATLNLRSPSGLHPRLFLPARRRADDPIVPEGWGLIGIPEPAKLPDLEEPEQAAQGDSSGITLGQAPTTTESEGGETA